jgi:hypothetical protein
MPAQVCQVHGRQFKARAGCPHCKRPKTRMSLRLEANQLVRALWRFIEDVTEDDPARTDKFFALRFRVREFYEHTDAD